LFFRRCKLPVFSGFLSPPLDAINCATTIARLAAKNKWQVEREASEGNFLFQGNVFITGVGEDMAARNCCPAQVEHVEEYE
jgi:hypothetical protein